MDEKEENSQRRRLREGPPALLDVMSGRPRAGGGTGRSHFFSFLVTPRPRAHCDLVTEEDRSRSWFQLGLRLACGR